MSRNFQFPKTAFIGFDSLMDDLTRISEQAQDSYPPHNVVKISDNSFLVELAVAGFAKEDITVDLKDNILTVSGNRGPKRPAEQYVHHGISNRKFIKSFRLSEFTEVAGAILKDGVLSLDIEVRTPEEKAAKLIDIN